MARRTVLKTAARDRVGGSIPSSSAIFESRCEELAIELEDRLCRYISSVQEHDLALPTAQPLVFLILGR